MRILGLDHVQVAMPASAEEKARAFYSGLLGLPEISKPAQLAGRGGVWFQCGSLQLHLGVEKNFNPAKKAHPALRVVGLETLLTTLRDGGFSVVDDVSIPEIRRSFTEDPFGNRIELIEVQDAH